MRKQKVIDHSIKSNYKMRIINYKIYDCPHCKLKIYINNNDINCKIFRHAAYKKNMINISPHSSKNVIEKMLKNNIIYGCGKPIKLLGFKLIKCDYI